MSGAGLKMGASGPETREPKVGRPPTGSALLRVGVAFGVLCALAMLTYAVPAGARVQVGPLDLELDRLKPWAAGDSPPLARLFENWGEEEIPAFAGAGGSYQAPVELSAAMESRLGKAVAANLGEARGGGRATGAAPTTGGGGGAAPAIRIEPQEYEGIDVDIENVANLRPFYEALERTAQREPGALTRVGHYGDSSIATDLITHTIRRRLQGRFGDGGHGWLLIARGTMPYSHRDVRHRASAAWELRQIVNNQDREGLYGYGGVAYRARPGAFAAFGTDRRGPVGDRVSRFALYYRRAPGGGRIRIRVDGGEPRNIETAAAEAADAVEVINVPDGPHELEVRPGGGGQIRLYGVALERDGPGVVYDSLGLVGARARRLLHYGQEHLQTQMSQRSPDLVVLGFGGNEADDPISRIPRYEEEFARVIRRMRAGRRETACLVFAPLDQAQRDAYGRIVTMPTVPLIVEAQRNAARREGCAFYNTFAAMGGEGAMREWARARPRLALADYRHATPAGYEVIGNMYYKALLKGFAEYLRGR